MATNCPTRPKLSQYLEGNVLYDSLPSEIYRDPAKGGAEPWRSTIGHPLSSTPGQIKPDSAVARCGAGATTYGPGFGLPSYCGMSTGSQYAIQSSGGQEAQADYIGRLQSYYNAFKAWINAASPQFLERLECYNQEDLVEVFSMLADFKGIGSKLTADEIGLLQEIADGAVCQYLVNSANNSKNAGMRSPDLDAYIYAINALDQSGPAGAGLYAWLIAPHLSDSRACIETLWDYDQALTAQGVPLPGSPADSALEQTGEQEGSAAAAFLIASMKQQERAKISGVNRFKKKTAAPVSMAPPPEAEAQQITDELEATQAAAIAEAEALEAALITKESEQYADFLDRCAKQGKGPEHTEYLDLYRGGSYQTCPPVDVPQEEQAKPNLALILGAVGFLGAGPVGGLAGAAAGAFLDQQKGES
jgi:hypothetical protein